MINTQPVVSVLPITLNGSSVNHTIKKVKIKEEPSYVVKFKSDPLWLISLEIVYHICFWYSIILLFITILFWWAILALIFISWLFYIPCLFIPIYWFIRLIVGSPITYKGEHTSDEAYNFIKTRQNQQLICEYEVRCFNKQPTGMYVNYQPVTKDVVTFKATYPVPIQSIDISQHYPGNSQLFETKNHQEIQYVKIFFQENYLILDKNTRNFLFKLKKVIVALNQMKNVYCDVKLVIKDPNQGNSSSSVENTMCVNNGSNDSLFSNLTYYLSMLFGFSFCFNRFFGNKCGKQNYFFVKKFSILNQSSSNVNPMQIIQEMEDDDAMYLKHFTKRSTYLNGRPLYGADAIDYDNIKSDPLYQSLSTSQKIDISSYTQNIIQYQQPQPQPQPQPQYQQSQSQPQQQIHNDIKF